MGVDEKLAERARKAGEAQATATGFELREKRMFGGLAFMLSDTMFVGVIDDELMVRVGPAAYEQALARPHIREMDFTGKPMRGYVFVEAAGCAKQADVARWVTRAAKNVAALVGSPASFAQLGGAAVGSRGRSAAQRGFELVEGHVPPGCSRGIGRNAMMDEPKPGLVLVGCELESNGRNG